LMALETLRLGSCSRLQSLPIEIGNLMALKTLNLDYCSRLQSLPREIGELMALETLRLGSCSRLQSLPTEIGNLKALRIFGGPEELRKKDTLPKLTHPHGQEHHGKNTTNILIISGPSMNPIGRSENSGGKSEDSRGKAEDPRGKSEDPRGKSESPRGRSEIPTGRSEIPRGRSGPKFLNFKLGKFVKRLVNPLQKLGANRAKSITEVTMPSSNQDSADAA
jgi:Leucine-rich repeat (LRR) protein